MEMALSPNDDKESWIQMVMQINPKNLINSALYRRWAILKMSSISIDTFLSNVAHRQPAPAKT